jgi:hypothetical protein
LAAEAAKPLFSQAVNEQHRSQPFTHAPVVADFPLLTCSAPPAGILFNFYGLATPASQLPSSQKELQNGLPLINSDYFVLTALLEAVVAHTGGASSRPFAMLDASGPAVPLGFWTASALTALRARSGAAAAAEAAFTVLHAGRAEDAPAALQAFSAHLRLNELEPSGPGRHALRMQHSQLNVTAALAGLPELLDVVLLDIAEDNVEAVLSAASSELAARAQLLILSVSGGPVASSVQANYAHGSALEQRLHSTLSRSPVWKNKITALKTGPSCSEQRFQAPLAFGNFGPVCWDRGLMVWMNTKLHKKA